jgi:hypothetical protein
MNIDILKSSSRMSRFLLIFSHGNYVEMLAELSRREKAANIKPDPDLDIYMKVS